MGAYCLSFNEIKPRKQQSYNPIDKKLHNESLHGNKQQILSVFIYFATHTHTYTHTDYGNSWKIYVSSCPMKE